MIQPFHRNFWMYIPTVPNSFEGWAAESTLGDWNISLRLQNYCSVFQAEVIAIYRAAQWIRANGVPFTRISIFSNSQAAIRSLSNVANNSTIVREYRRCFNPFAGRFRVTLIRVLEHCDIPGNCRSH